MIRSCSLINSSGTNDIRQSQSSGSENATLIISVILAVVVLFLILVIVGFIFWKRLKRSDGSLGTSVSLETVHVIGGGIVKEEKLGSGNFGDVYRGKWNGLPVALKSLKNEEHVAEFEQEAAVLEYAFPSFHPLTLQRKLNHPHIVRYLGIHEDEAGKRYIVTEFVAKGSLADAIVADKNKLKTVNLLRM